MLWGFRGLRFRVWGFRGLEGLGLRGLRFRVWGVWDLWRVRARGSTASGLGLSFVLVLRLGSPAVPFYPFSFWVPLLKPNSRKKGTLIIKGLLGNLDSDLRIRAWGLRSRGLAGG